ncbi:MAG TPA: hypothetical protein VJR24_03990 [Gemmatimonadaceae bacterium]|nr:hypothetical protein [Gemmatimonadaceae bacterium]
MARALTIRRSIVPLADRKKFLQRLKARRTYFVGAGCKFWVFEESDLAGAFVEFVEADDAKTLAKALADSSDQPADAVRIYEEVDVD